LAMMPFGNRRLKGAKGALFFCASFAPKSNAATYFAGHFQSVCIFPLQRYGSAN
jgi:hypothetical protein